jgi:hypothetical protein
MITNKELEEKYTLKTGYSITKVSAVTNDLPIGHLITDDDMVEFRKNINLILMIKKHINVNLLKPLQMKDDEFIMRVIDLTTADKTFKGHKNDIMSAIYIIFASDTSNYKNDMHSNIRKDFATMNSVISIWFLILNYFALYNNLIHIGFMSLRVTVHENNIIITSDVWYAESIKGEIKRLTKYLKKYFVKDTVFKIIFKG